MPSRRPASSAARWPSWPFLVFAISILPVLGVFTTTRIFFVRDLSFFFWPRHLWLRHTVFSGQVPWWDPFVAGGQSAIADALNQLVMPVTLALRLLPSDVVSFNLWVALPLPIAALGMYAFLRARVPAAAAALGGCIFALSGPAVSMLNTPNLSWSVALLPWVMWSVATRTRSGEGRPLAIALLYALQALCGEPVTWAATGLLAACHPCPGGSLRRTLAPHLTTVAALAAGALLASAQLVPTFLAGVRAHRAALATPDFWSLHPLGLWETVAPNLFGNYYDAFLADLPWMGALNFGRDPFFYSVYVGPLVLLLALAGAALSTRRNWFWILVLVAAVIATLGGYTPLYPMLRKLVPPLMYFRFPVKYIVFAVFACAVLAADGWTLLVEPEGANDPGAGDEPAARAWFTWMPAVAGALGLLLVLAVTLRPSVALNAAHALALSTHLKDPWTGAAFLARTGPPLAARGFGLLLGAAVLIAGAARRRWLAAVLFAAVCADLVVTNGPLNITMDATKLVPPDWYRASAGPQRLYIGGRARGYMNTDDADGVPTWQIPAEGTAVEGRMDLNAQLPMAPSGWGIREALSYDLPYLWPAEYEQTLRRFEQAGPEQRAAFLRRSGVRRCVLPNTETRQFRAVADVRDWNMRVFECNPGATRVYLPASFTVAPDAADLAWQREALFDTRLRDEETRLAAAPRAAGIPGPPGPSDVRLVEDRTSAVTIEATLRQPGLVVLRDSYDPSWSARVDGAAAEVARANGIYRAVALPAGRHVIRFTYRPRDFLVGLTMSMFTAVLIGFSRFAARPRRREAGFTLIELMIVLAIIGILLAIAFTEYRGMQARGNDASAVGSMRAIATAQWQFASTCANGKYATTLPGLGQPVPVTGQAFLSPDLTSAESFEKSGFKFQMAAKPLDQAPPACNGATVAEGYAATADPVNPGVTGTNFYGVNADRVIYVDEAQTFTENLGGSGAAGHGHEIK